jgi:hypothetical protein
LQTSVSRFVGTSLASIVRSAIHHSPACVVPDRLGLIVLGLIVPDRLGLVAAYAHARVGWPRYGQVACMVAAQSEQINCSSTGVC